MRPGRELPRWPFGLKLLACVFLFAGCGDAASPYRSVMRDQAAAFDELERVLSTVTDEASMETARAELAKSWKRCEAIKERALELGPPGYTVREEVEPETRKLNQAFESVQRQMSRIKVLPGGEQFLQSLALGS